MFSLVLRIDYSLLNHLLSRFTCRSKDSYRYWKPPHLQSAALTPSVPFHNLPCSIITRDSFSGCHSSAYYALLCMVIHSLPLALVTGPCGITTTTTPPTPTTPPGGSTPRVVEMSLLR